MKVTVALIPGVLFAAVCHSQEAPRPPDEQTIVLRLLDVMAVGEDVARYQAASELSRYAERAGPLLRRRLEDPGLPRWVFAANTLFHIAPAELAQFEASLPTLPVELTVRYRLWQCARLKRPPWGYREPFTEDRGAAEPYVAAIAALGQRAVPELVQSLDDAKLRNQAVYVLGSLKLEAAAPHLVEHIVDTQVKAYAYRSKEPPRAYSLAVQALAAMGTTGHRVLLDYLSHVRFTAIPEATRPRPREAADLIVANVTHASLRPLVEKALVGLVDSDAQAVGAWALTKVVALQGQRKGQRGHYGLDVELDKLIGLLSETTPNSKAPSQRAKRAAGYLAWCVEDPRALAACTAEFEKGRFVDILVETWSKRRGEWARSGDSAAHALRARLRRALRREIETSDPYWKHKGEALQQLTDKYRRGDRRERAERNALALPVVKRLLLNDPSDRVRATAVQAFHDIMQDRGRHETYEVLAQAIRKELGRPRLKSSSGTGAALANMVKHIPYTPRHNPRPLFDSILGAHLASREPGRQVIERLTSVGELSSVETILSHHAAPFVDERTSIRLGFHLLPLAVQQVNTGKPDAALIALRAIERLARYPEKESKYRHAWASVIPDTESSALARLAAQHIGEGVPRLLDRSGAREVSRPDIETAICSLQVSAAIPWYMRQLVTQGIPHLRRGWAAYMLSHFELTDADYDRLLQMASKGDRLALKALSGTANEAVASLYDQYRSAPDLIVPCLLRVGDERGLDLFLDALRHDRYHSGMHRAIPLLGRCKTSSAAQKLVDHLNSPGSFRAFPLDALRQIGGPAVPAILRALADPAWPMSNSHRKDRLRRQLIDVLGHIGDERAVPILKWQCSTQRGDAMRAAFMALCAIQTESAKQVVLDEIDERKLLDWRLSKGVAELFRGDPRAAELFTAMAEQATHDSPRGFAATRAAEETATPEQTRRRLYALWVAHPKSRASLTPALVTLGDERVAQEAFKGLYTNRKGTFLEALARLDRAGLEDYANELINSGKKCYRERGLEILAWFGERKHEKVFWELLESPESRDRFIAAKALARMSAPGAARELVRRLRADLLSDFTVVRALGMDETDEAADVLIEWLRDAAQEMNCAERRYWWILEALRSNGRPKAMAAYRETLYQHLAGTNIPCSRRSLRLLAEIDRPGLAIRLVNMAASPHAHLRCVSRYGLMKHYGYEGPYDPFGYPQNSDAIIRGLKAHLATVAGMDTVAEPE